MAGTPFYISPELSRNEKYSKKTDIWSLGCVIYEVCALEKPFKTSKGFMDLIRLIQNSEPPALPSMYSKDINILIKKMITKDASKRPSASDLIRDRIVVNLMMNYSSQINLLDEYKNNLN
jgi:serine/threonine protein kinase